MRVAALSRLCLLGALAGGALTAAEHRGQALFNGLPVPGASVTASQGDTQAVAATDSQGYYEFSNLAEGVWTIEIRMFGFETAVGEIVLPRDATERTWRLEMLPLERIQARKASSPAPAAAQKASPERRRPPPAGDSAGEEDLLQARAADGLLINGSVNLGADSPFSRAAAFGNFRSSGRSPYRGGIAMNLGASAFDARPYSLTGQEAPKAPYSRVTGAVNLGGPFRIPGLLRQGPVFFAGYQWTRNNDATMASALMPDAAMRSGVFQTPVLDPDTGAPFPGAALPQSRLSPQAQFLLQYYPQPNAAGGGRYNYQTPLVLPAHEDALQSRFNQNLGTNHQVYGSFAFQSVRRDSPNVFGFLDKSGSFGLNADLSWQYRIGRGRFLNLSHQLSRLSSDVTPFFQNRENVSGLAGISGNNQEPAHWGPPALVFSSGVAGLFDAQSAFNRSQTASWSASMLWSHGAHNVTFGADIRRLQFNYLYQQDPRGTFTFAGDASGSDFADFLLGLPSASSIAFGNADKYLRQSVYDAYVVDDWRLSSAVTLNLGMRWQYGSPVTERHGRLANLDFAPGFAAAVPVTASEPAGLLSGRRFPEALLGRSPRGFEPRLGLAWKPMPASSLVVRAGYGLYHDTAVYPGVALEMAQQPPFSKTLRLENSEAHPLTLADGFSDAAAALGNTFAVDPDFRVGYAQLWQLSVQRDLPGSLQLTAQYLGTKGSRAMQAVLPNTYPAGTANPCPECPAGFTYVSSNGASSRHAADIQLRRRLRGGLTAALQYTFSKSIDNAAGLGGGQLAGGGAPSGGRSQAALPGAGGLAIAQNWLDLGAERGLSPFHQQHALNLGVQYSTGMSLGGGAMLKGWRAAALGGWTMATRIQAGSGLPQTPVWLTTTPGTGVTGTLRPDATGEPLYAAPPGLRLNPDAYAQPQPGHWGNAGRSSIVGPDQLTLNASLGRSFQVADRLTLDVRADAVNALNRPNYTAYNTVVNGAQFGVPAATSAMRTVQTTVRLRF